MALLKGPFPAVFISWCCRSTLVSLSLSFSLLSTFPCGALAAFFAITDEKGPPLIHARSLAVCPPLTRIRIFCFLYFHLYANSRQRTRHADYHVEHMSFRIVNGICSFPIFSPLFPCLRMGVAVGGNGGSFEFVETKI